MLHDSPGTGWMTRGVLQVILVVHLRTGSIQQVQLNHLYRHHRARSPWPMT